jgi:hypothetical protein
VVDPMPKISVTHITIKHGNGPDILVLDTALPPTCFPWVETASLTLMVAAGTGEAYCAEHLPGVPVLSTPV